MIGKAKQRTASGAWRRWSPVTRW